MPPKKKQQEIDLSTLPQCITANGMLYCTGKKQRSERIIKKIQQQSSSFISRISKQEVLEHAKQKNIYVDPNTLNDKQKKDPKFMESICTELTSQVIAKATKSYIAAQSVKIRLQIKAEGQKPQQERTKPIIDKRFNQLYIFNDFPDTKQDFEALASVQENIKYVLIINPVINWSSAPQLPEQQQQEQDPNNQQPQQEDEQIKQFKELQKKQEFSQQDLEHRNTIQSRISQIKLARSQSSSNSAFRDCIIQFVNVQIDPYNQEQSVQQAVKAYHARLSKLSLQYEEFLEWKKDKVQEKIINENKPKKVQDFDQQSGEKQQIKQHETNQINQKQTPKQKLVTTQAKAKGKNTIQILSNFVDGLFHSKQQNQEIDDSLDYINNFNFDDNIEDNQQDDQTAKRRQKNSQFICENQNINFNEQSRYFEQETREKLQYPGLNRYMMPELPTRSGPLRKLNQSYYSQFLNSSSLSYEQFDRRLSLQKFQQILKQSDQERNYNLSDRVYQQNHDEKSLMRELYRAMSLNQGHFLTKYNEQNDKLYVALLYKNNQRRLHSKQWQGNWKVLPNYQSWLKYFKQNENNFNTQQFYDIDYEKIGHINDQVNAFSIPDGGVIVKKHSTIANQSNKLLYAIKNHHLFGLNDNGKVFYSENGQTKIFHYQYSPENSTGVKEKSQSEERKEQLQQQQQKLNQDKNRQILPQYETSIIINENLRLRLRKSGDVIIQNKNQSRRTYTPDGYTIIYSNNTNNSQNDYDTHANNNEAGAINNTNNNDDYKILHPNGSLSAPNSYTNQRGYGMLNGVIHNVPTLLRRTDDFSIVKRDDNTVIVQDNNNKKWIKFYEGTEYMIESDGSISIEKKDYPFIRCLGGRITVYINDIVIEGSINSQDALQYKFNIKFNDGNCLQICGSEIKVTEMVSDIPYIANISDDNKNISVEFQNEKIQISYQNQLYLKNNKLYDPLQNQQNYGQNQSIPQDIIDPKLFIINPDNNTGVEYLNENQLNYYFCNKQKHQKLCNITKIPHQKQGNNSNSNGDDESTIHVISKIIEPSQLNPKRIQPNFDIDLDVFKSEKYFKQKNIIDKYTVRSLIKHKCLMPEDQQQLENIKQKKQVWLKQAKKDENQYGSKPKGDLYIEQSIKEKKIMIDFRRKPQKKVDFQSLKQEAIAEWKNQQKQHMTMVAQQEQQNKIRNRMNQRKTSVVQEYPSLVIKQKQEEDNTENYSPAGFYGHYFQTIEGKKALSHMPDWVFRPKTAKQKKQLDPQIVTELNNTMNRTKQEEPSMMQDHNNERYDTVDVNLNPQREIYIKPSVFTQRQIDQERFAFEQQKKAYFYHEKKRKDFDIYGSERRQKPQVRTLMRTQPISEINQKYLITEAPLDKKVKISSMKNKLTSNASSLVEMRKQGPHNTLMKTMDKRNDYSQLLQKRTMMVHADLNDKLQRDVLIAPIEANFGYLKEGRIYQFRINVKNQDILAQRIALKKPRNVVAKVSLSEMGPIALGMSRKVIVQLKAASEYLGKYVDEFEIVSKHEIYKIPINATILSESQFENQHIRLSGGVKEILEPIKRRPSDLPPIN